MVAHDPPTLCIGICVNTNRGAYTHKKDSLNNIEETGEFVVNIIGNWMMEAASHTCIAAPPDVDKFDLSGLTRLPSEVVSLI